jgi:membrane associated rhomboid family serine protease
VIPIHDDNPSRSTPFVTWTLMTACLAVFLWQAGLDGRAAQAAVYRFGLVPAVFVGEVGLAPGLAPLPPALTVLTSMFLHGGFMHLAGNLLYLWIFGNNVEDALGPSRFTVFYVASGLAAALAQIMHAPSSAIPMIGASGAISGVLGAYLLFFPRARVTVLIPLGFMVYTARWPAAWVLGAWFLLQLVSSLLADPGAPGVAWLAHVGGFVAGLFLAPLLRAGRPS